MSLKLKTRTFISKCICSHLFNVKEWGILFFIQHKKAQSTGGWHYGSSGSTFPSHRCALPQSGPLTKTPHACQHSASVNQQAELTSSFIRHDLPLALSFSIGVTPLQDCIPNYFLTLQARSLVKVAQWQRGLIWTHDHPATVDTAVKWLTAEPSAGAALTKQTHQHAQWPNAHFDKRRRGAEIRELVHACVRLSCARQGGFFGKCTCLGTMDW